MTSPNLQILYVLLASKHVADKLRVQSPDLVALANDYVHRQTGHVSVVAMQNSDTPTAKVDEVVTFMTNAILQGNLHKLKPPAPPVPKPEPKPEPPPNDVRAIVRAECDEIMKCIVVQTNHKVDELYDKLHRLVASLVRNV